jgi:hypothetical protein
VSRIERTKFLDLLELVGAGLSTRDAMGQADCYVFKDGYIITFNDEVAVQIKSPIPEIKGAVKAEPLRAILHKLDADTIEVEQGDKELVLRVRKSETIGIRMEKKIELPLENLETPTKWKPLPTKFTEAVEYVQSCAGKDDANFAMTCVHIHPEFVEACDNWKFARYRLKLKIKKEFLVRQVSLKSIINLSMIEFCESKKWVHFRNARKLILSCRRHMETYKNMNNIAGMKGKKLELPKNLIDKADRAEVFSKDDPKGDNHINVFIRPGRVELKGEGQYGRYHGTKKLDYSGEPFDFMIQPQMLIQLVKQHTECEVNNTAMRAESGRAVFVTSIVPPEEVKKQEEKKSKKKKGKKK